MRIYGVYAYRSKAKLWWRRNRAVVALIAFAVFFAALMLWNLADARQDVSHACAWTDTEVASYE